MKKQEVYETLSFSSKGEAVKNKYEIESHFNERLINSKVLYRQDERGNTGHYIEYTILN